MTSQSERPAGSVDRLGGRLIIESPSGMTPNAWAVLAQELMQFASAIVASPTMVSVPTDQAGEVRRILLQPWPGGMWPWTWTRAAADAAESAAGLDAALVELLASAPPDAAAIDAVRAELEATAFSRTLLPAQMAAVTELLLAGSGGNFSVPGSGKTTMTYALFALLRSRGLVDRMLVVAPQSAYEAWTGEAADCFSEGRAPSVEITPTSPRRSTDVVVFNYERVAMGTTRAAIDAWGHGRRFMVAFDEAHRAKRGESGAYGAGARDVARLAQVRFALTGTPMPNRRTDLASILDLAWPGQGERLADPNTPNGDRAWVRIAKQDLGLDEAEVTVETVELDPAHQQIYQAVASGFARHASLLDLHPGLAARATARMIAAASNPVLLLESGDQVLGWPDELPGQDVALRELLDDLANVAHPRKLLHVARAAEEHRLRGDKLLVWTNFLGNVRELERVLAPHNPATVTGMLPLHDGRAPRDRERELKRFRTDPECRVLIATPQTLGEGVSLHKVCQSQIHLDRSYNAGLFLQALDRTHRVGMPAGTHARVTLLVAKGTIDENVHASLTAKLIRMNDVLEDPTLRRLALPGADDQPSARLSAADRHSLLRHLKEGGDAGAV